MSKPILEIQNLSFQFGSNVVLKNLNFKINKNENWQIGGPSGTGKTTLAKIISGEIKNFEGNIKINFDENSELKQKVVYVANWYQFTNLEGDRNFYYQQRYNKFAKNDTLTVFAELNHFAQKEQLDFKNVEKYLEIFDFQNFKEQQLIELSSGEHKKLQLVKAFWLKPQILIIDQPYTGLDVKSRKNVNQIFENLTQEGITLLLINNDDEVPSCINRFAEIKNGSFLELTHHSEITKGEERTPKELPYFLQKPPKTNAKEMVKLENVNVSYGEKKVLKNINWQLNEGERWLLQGPNGSGKSTLLSLLNGDHPQAYANQIYLFGKKRGSGESIWDIKEKIGIISPELHWYYDLNANVAQTIASGFFDSMSLYQKLSFEQQQKLEQILLFFDLKEDKNKKLNTLSLGKQRLALLARTIVKNPELLILDEPCQGLDVQQTKYFNRVVDDLCNSGHTLIYVGHFESQLPESLSHKLILEKGEIKNEKFQ